MTDGLDCNIGMVTVINAGKYIDSRTGAKSKQRLMIYIPQKVIEILDLKPGNLIDVGKTSKVKDSLPGKSRFIKKAQHDSMVDNLMNSVSQ